MDKIKKALSSNKEETTCSISNSSTTSQAKSPRRSSKPAITPTSEQIKEVKVGNTANTEIDAGSSAVQTQKVVAPVTHNVIQREETEEVTRAREHEKHFHHVQHHVQPVKDKEVRDEVHHTKVAPTTVIQENLSATAEDAAAYESIGKKFKDTESHVDKKRGVVDRGEKVDVKEHHHIHSVIQPVINKETHDRHRIHTTIPIHHITHEKPIIHNSINHEPLNMDEFLKRGGSLNSNKTHSEIGNQLLTTKDEKVPPNNTQEMAVNEVNSGTQKLNINA